MHYEIVIAGPFQFASRVASAIQAGARVRVVAIVPNAIEAKDWLRAHPTRRIVVLLDPAARFEPQAAGMLALRFRRGPGGVELLDTQAQPVPPRLYPIAAQIVKALSPPTDHDPAGEVEGRRLSPRDRQVLKLLCAGSSNAHIARELGLSVGTTKNYVTRLFQLLSVRKRSEAILKGVELGLVGQPSVRRVGVAAWINDEAGRVLLHQEMDGAWSLPGGRVELGETLKAALRREVKEETGLEISVGHLIGVYSDPQDQRHSDGTRIHEYVTVYARASMIGSQSALIDGARFFNVKALRSLTLAPMSPYWLEDALGNSRHSVWR